MLTLSKTPSLNATTKDTPPKPVKRTYSRTRSNVESINIHTSSRRRRLVGQSRAQSVIHTPRQVNTLRGGADAVGSAPPSLHQELPSTVPDSSKPKMSRLASQQEGDTQPYSQTVYDKLLGKDRSQPVSKEAPAATGETTHTHDATPFTYSQGNPGHIDLLAAFEQPTLTYSEETPESDSADELGGTTQLDVRAEPYPESKRFKQSKTPATHGKKRSRNGEFIEPSNTTPRLPVNPFAGHMGEIGGTMDLSQVFQTTQAGSSPLWNKLPSEATSERPSPGFFPMQRRSTADSLSSPAKIPHANFQRAVTEPQTTYISMKASQDERERQLVLQRAAALNCGSGEELSDDDFESQGSLLRRHMNQKRIESIAKDEFVGITAPSRPGLRGYSRAASAKGSESHHPPRSSGRREDDAVIISDDINGEETQGNATEDETEHEEDNDAVEIRPPSEMVEEDKENFDLGGLQVPMTTSSNAARVSLQDTIQDSPSYNRHRGLSPTANKNLIKHLTKPDDKDISNRSTGSSEKIEINLRGSQTVAIADSQPSQPRTKDSKTHNSEPLPSPAQASSSETRAIIPQSQSCPLALNTPLQPPRARQLQQVDSSSLPPGPPPMSSPVLHSSPSLPQNTMSEAALRSSPPQLRPPEDTPGTLSTPVGSPRLNHHHTTQQLPQPMEETEKKTALAEIAAEITEDKVETAVHPDIARMKKSINIAEGTLRSTIPESNLSSGHIRGSLASASVPNAMRASSQPQPSLASSSAVGPAAKQHSTGSTMFETAQTHLEGSPSKQRLRSTRHQSEPSWTSPSSYLKRTRTLTEIASDPTPPDAVGDVDVDVGLITTEDMAFQAAIEGSSPIGPAKKRRRGRDERVLQVAEQQPNQLPPGMLSDTQDRENDGAQAAVAARRNAMRRHVPEDVKNRGSSNLRPQSTGSTRGTLVTQKPATKAVASSIAKHHTTNNLNPAMLDKKPHHGSRIQVLRDKAGTAPGIGIPHQEVQPEETRVMTAVEEDVLAPNRVFAAFNGTYHPATCLGFTRDKEPRYRIRFDDGTIGAISRFGVRKLDLRKGDIVKIDLPGARTKTYIVEGFKDRMDTPHDPQTPCRNRRSGSSESVQYPKVDLYGYATVTLLVKQRGPVSPLLDVGITNVYLTQTMWTTFNDRLYSYAPNQQPLPPGPQTPSETISASTTPSSRIRRSKASMSGRAVSSTTSVAPSRTAFSLFKDVVFAVSQIEQEDRRKQTIDHITTNGGRLVDDGFDELFIIPGFEPTSPSKRSPKTAKSSFRLNHQAESLGFTCLIADKHGRKTKYIQALALGIPCLATRWVHDCVSKQTLLPWEPYLLPSGESTFLNGAVSSRLLLSYPPNTARLATIIESRPQWLSGRSVLLVMGEEKRKAYHFLTHALGARRVARAGNLEAARRMLVEGGEAWDLVYVEGSEEVAERVLLGGERGGKRKRGRSEGGVAGRVGKVRVVGDQFVIQGLILGTLVEE